MDEVATLSQQNSSNSELVHLQIYIVQLQFLQANLQGVFDIMDVGVINFGGYKQLLTLNTRLLDSGSKLLFCLVHWTDRQYYAIFCCKEQ